MAESRVVAVRVGLAAAGVFVLAMLAGHSVGSNEAGQILFPPEAVVPAAAEVLQADRQPAADSEVSTIGPATTRRPLGPVATDAVTTMSPSVPTLPETLLLPPASSNVAGATQPAPGPDLSLLDRSGEFPALPVSGDIRSVDFRNGFTYQVVGTGPITVVDGYAPKTALGHRIDFTINLVTYGDATGDGRDDAVVSYHYVDQRDRPVAVAQVFSIDSGLLMDWGATRVNYWAIQKIMTLDVRPGLVIVEALGGDRSLITQMVWGVQGPGSRLRRLEVSPERQYMDIRGLASAASELAPRQGALRSVIVAAGGDGEMFTFDAESSWMLSLPTWSGAEPSVRVWEQSTGRLVGDAEAGEFLQLGAAGRYVGEVIADGEVSFDLLAADHRTLLAPTWEPRSRTEVTEDPVSREATLEWPEFTSAAGAADLTAVNATIREFVEGRLQKHRAEVSTTCDVDERSMLELTYRLTLVSYDLVSINFNEFVCMCQNGDSTESHILTIDLNTGQRLGDDRIVPGGLDTLVDPWWQNVGEQHPYIVNPDPDLPAFEFAGFSSVILSPRGLTPIGRMEYDDGNVWFVGVELSFEDLDGLIDPAIATRAASGAAVVLPIEEGCGC